MYGKDELWCIELQNGELWLWTVDVGAIYIPEEACHCETEHYVKLAQSLVLTGEWQFTLTHKGWTVYSLRNMREFSVG